MSTATLTLYKDSKLDNSKNYVVDSIDTFLATLTSVSVNIQYQRFELNKTVKIDLTQDYQTKGTTFNKYDYAKIVTTVDQATVTYYYFILRATQKAQSTIEFELRMDTLNTFAFSSTIANNAYTLSPKTMVNREHKDRLEYQGTAQYYEASEMSDDTLEIVENWKAGTWDYGTFFIRFDFDGLVNEYNSRTPTGLTFPLRIEPQDDSMFITFTQKNGKYVQTLTVYALLIYTDYLRIYTSSSSYVDWTLSALSNYNLIISVAMLSLSGTSATFSNSTLWNFIEPFFLEDYEYTSTTKYLYTRIINQYQEGISTQLFKTSEETLLDEDGTNQWYMVYASKTAVTSDVNYQPLYVNPVQVRFYSDNGYTLSTSSDVEYRLYAYSSLIPKIKNAAENIYSIRPSASGSEYAIVAGTTYDLYTYQVHMVRTNNNDLVFSSVEVTRISTTATVVSLSNVEYVGFQGVSKLLCKSYSQVNYSGYIYITSTGSSDSGTSSSWSSLDTTDARLIKAFAFPYCPIQALVGVSDVTQAIDNLSWNADGFFELTLPQNANFKYQKSFDTTCPIGDVVIMLDSASVVSGISRNISYESQLYHSDYFQPKFVYDSFSFPFRLEDVDQDEFYSQFGDTDVFLTTYVVSANVQSKFAFIFDQYVLKRSTQDYDDVLCIERNNEKALFNNAYINYIRSGGYSYDTKKASSQNAVNGITTALSIIGSVASFAGGAVSGNPMLAVAGIGLATSATASIVRGIHTAQEQDRAISQKLLQSQMQGTTVQGSEDIDILTAFSQNKAKLVYYELSDIMKQAMWDLFHYCGYATHEQKVPDVTTRLYFNFVSADIIFDEYNFNEDVADDIRNKWKEGITFFHLVSGSYNFDQDYENFETSLL